MAPKKKVDFDLVRRERTYTDRTQIHATGWWYNSQQERFELWETWRLNGSNALGRTVKTEVHRFCKGWVPKIMVDSLSERDLVEMMDRLTQKGHLRRAG